MKIFTVIVLGALAACGKSDRAAPGAAGAAGTAGADLKDITLTLASGHTLAGKLPAWTVSGGDTLTMMSKAGPAATMSIMGWTAYGADLTAEAAAKQDYPAAWLTNRTSWTMAGETIVWEPSEQKVLADNQPFGAGAWVTAVEVTKKSAGSPRMVIATVQVPVPDFTSPFGNSTPYLGFRCELVVRDLAADKLEHTSTWKAYAEACAGLKVAKK